MNAKDKARQLIQMADRQAPMTNEVVTVQDILKNHPKKTPMLLEVLKRARKSRDV